MSLNNQIRLSSALLVVSSFLMWWFYFQFLDWRFQLGLLIFTLSAGLAFSAVLAKRSLSRFTQALFVEDVTIARREYRFLEDRFRRARSNQIRRLEINILIVEGRFQEALAALRAVHLEKPNATFAPHKVQMAWCQVNLGQAADGVEVARSVLGDLEKIGPEFLSSGHLVIGVGLLSLGRPADAVPHLQAARAHSSSASRQSAADFYLGEAIHATGDVRSALEYYALAVKALPTGRYGVKASQQLQQR